MTAQMFIDPRMMSALGSHFPVAAWVQYPTETVDDDGQVVTVWETRYENIPCMPTPLTGKEIKRPNQTYVVAHTAIALQGYYPDIKETDRVIVDEKSTVSELQQTPFDRTRDVINRGTVYDILLVEHILDTMTRLSCEVVR